MHSFDSFNIIKSNVFLFLWFFDSLTTKWQMLMRLILKASSQVEDWFVHSIFWTVLLLYPNVGMLKCSHFECSQFLFFECSQFLSVKECVSPVFICRFPFKEGISWIFVLYFTLEEHLKSQRKVMNRIISKNEIALLSYHYHNKGIVIHWPLCVFLCYGVVSYELCQCFVLEYCFKSNCTKLTTVDIRERWPLPLFLHWIWPVIPSFSCFCFCCQGLTRILEESCQ